MNSSRTCDSTCTAVRDGCGRRAGGASGANSAERLTTLRKRRQRVIESEVKRQKVGEVEGEKVGTSSGRTSARLAAQRNATKAARSAESAEQRSGIVLLHRLHTDAYSSSRLKSRHRSSCTTYFSS